MKTWSRRCFLKTSTAAAAAAITLPVVDGNLFGLGRIEASGYFEREFGITDEMCREVLAEALSKGGDFADLFFEHTISNSIMLEDGKVNRASGNISLGVGIRTVNGDQVGYGFTQELEKASMLKAAATAASIASSSQKKPAETLKRLKTKNYYPLDKLLTDIPFDSRLPHVKNLNEKCFSLSPLVRKVNAHFHDQQKRIMIVTSGGVKVEDLQPRNYLAASVVAEKNGRYEQAGWNMGGRRSFSFYTPEVIGRIAEKAVGQAVTLFDAVQPPAGEVPVVLGPGVTAVLLHEA
ncbi:MAG: PmbA/TldA family metallopeptidase, partial [Candidatus Aminicenantaceae bacterium]